MREERRRFSLIRLHIFFSTVEGHCQRRKGKRWRSNQGGRINGSRKEEGKGGLGRNNEKESKRQERTERIPASLSLLEWRRVGQSAFSKATFTRKLLMPYARSHSSQKDLQYCCLRFCNNVASEVVWFDTWILFIFPLSIQTYQVDSVQTDMREE